MSQHSHPPASWLSPEALEKIIEMFFADAPEQIAGLQSALESGDIEKLGVISHNLRSSAAFLGTNSILALASAVEKKALQRDAAQAFQLTSQLVAEMQRLLRELAGVEDEENT